MQSIWKNLVIDYPQETEYRDLKREILDNGVYYFETQQDKPIIIDGGAHIGLASLYWKWLYPEAQIVAVEPNPELVKYLRTNIEQNHLTAVEVIEGALSRHHGETTLYVDATDWQWWSVGSLHRGAWNGQQKNQKEILVKTIKLADIVQKLSRIDLLKMDIEGMEQKVLLSLKDQLVKVERVIMEWHPIKDQNMDEARHWLEKRGMRVNLKNHKNRSIRTYRPDELVLLEAWR